jgi:hypothetical protein
MIDAYKLSAQSQLNGTVILHRMWIDGTEFNWSKKEIAA